ncbi:30S ribosomal protein S12 methylthiotransferase RimO, partial [Candidatus Atribacteria bacterium HGW-Atribacteria-1]
IRLLYTHPAHYNEELIEVIASYPKICSYLDLPLQHINDKILKRMNRPVEKNYVISLINKLRDRISNLTLRTTFMVGFPGESDQDFEELLNFVKNFRFERLGAFIFSREEGTPAYDFPQQIPMRIKKERLKKFMLTQQSISKEINSFHMGKEIEVLIDEIKSGKPKIAIGRTKGDTPEIDGKVVIRGGKTKVGKFIKVKVTKASEYDLVGEISKL